MNPVTELRTFLKEEGVLSAQEMERIGISLAVGDVPRHRARLAKRYIVSNHNSILLNVKFIPHASGFSAEDLLKTRTLYAGLDFFKVPALVAHGTTGEGHFFVEEYLPAAISLGRLVETGETSGRQAAEITRRILWEIWNAGQSPAPEFIRQEKERYRTYLETFTQSMASAFLKKVLVEDLERTIDDHMDDLRQVYSSGDIIDQNILRSKGVWYLIDFEYSHRTLFLFKEAYRNLLYSKWAQGLGLREIFPPLGGFPEEAATLLSLAWEKHLHAQVMDQRSDRLSYTYLRRLFWNRLDPQEEQQVQQLQAAVQSQQEMLLEKEKVIAHLTQAVSQGDARVARLKGRVLRKEVEIHRLNEQVAQNEAHITQLNDAVSRKEAEMRALSGKLGEKNAALARLSASLTQQEARLERLNRAIHQKQEDIAHLNAKMGRKEMRMRHLYTVIHQKEAHNGRLTEIIAEREQRIAHLNTTLSQREARLAHLETSLKEKEATLNSISHSHGWYVLSQYYRWRDRLLPQASTRRVAVRVAFNTMLKPRQVLKNLHARHLREFLYFYKHGRPAALAKRIERKLLNEHLLEPPQRPLQRDLLDVFQKRRFIRLSPLNRAPLDERVLGAIEMLDRPVDGRKNPLLDHVIADGQLPEVNRAYLVRLLEATEKTVRHRHLFPQCRVQADLNALKKDALALLFLYHLFSFRDVSLSWVSCADRTASSAEEPASLMIRDNELGSLRVQGDGRQFLTFRLRNQTTATRSIGWAVQQPSFEFLTHPRNDAAYRDRSLAPSFSLVIPVYDRSIDLMEAVASVLNQDYPWVELVLVFNGSPKHTLHLVPEIRALAKARRYRQKIIILPQAYGSANIPRNIGCFASTGDFIVFLDSDDYLDTPNFISQLEKVARAAEERCGILYPRTVEFVNIDRDHAIRGNLVATRPPRCDWNVLYQHGNVLNNSGVCVRKSTFLEVGGINPQMEYCEDYELFLRLVGKTGYGLPFDAKIGIKLHTQNNEIRFEAQKSAWEARARDSAEFFLAEMWLA